MSYATEILADSPYLYWHLDEPSGTNAADASGNSRTGTYTGSPTLGQAPLIAVGTSVLFTPTAYCINSAAINLSTASVEVWFDYDGTPPGGISNKGFIAGFTEGLNGGVGDKILYLDFSGRIAFYVFDGAQKTTVGANPLSAGVHHLVGTIDAGASELKVYVDGAQDGTTITASGSFTGYGAPNVLCGGDSAAQSNMSGFAPTARRDEFAVYSTALSSARVAAHYNARLDAGTPSAPQIMVPRHAVGAGRW